LVRSFVVVFVFLVFVFVFVDFIQMSISKEQLALARGDSSQVQPSRTENTTSYS